MFIVSMLVSLYSIVLFIRFLMQWIDKDGTNQINTALKPMTEPVLAPIRDKVTFSGIDFSPIVVSIVISIVFNVLVSFM